MGTCILKPRPVCPLPPAPREGSITWAIVAPKLVHPRPTPPILDISLVIVTPVIAKPAYHLSNQMKYGISGKSSLVPAVKGGAVRLPNNCREAHTVLLSR